MKVRMNTRMAGDHGNFAPGDVADLNPAMAKELIRTKQADPLSRAQTASVEPEAERATEPEPQTRRRKRKS